MSSDHIWFVKYEKKSHVAIVFPMCKHLTKCSIKKLIWAILETQFSLCFIRIFISGEGSKSCSISSWENKYNIYMLVTLCVFFFREVSYKDHNQQAKCWKWVSSSSFLWFVYFWHEQFDEELTNKKKYFLTRHATTITCRGLIGFGGCCKILLYMQRRRCFWIRIFLGSEKKMTFWS